MSQLDDASSESNAGSNKKIDAIYSLREAAEAKALAEVKVEASPTPAARDALLDAQLELEARTHDAVESCHECGRAHADDAPHYSNNVLEFSSAGRATSDSDDRSGTAPC